MAVDTWDGLTGHDPWEGLTGHDRHAACLVAARDGNRRALDVLVADLTPLVWHVTRSQGLDKVHAEDVVQTVWLALLRHLDRLQQPKALAAWLIVTARREAQRAKTTGYERETPVAAEDLVDIPTQVDGPEQHALRDDRDRRLWAAFKLLTERCQKLLTLTVLSGRAQYDAVAEALEMPRGSIGPTRGRCLIALRELLDQEGGPQ
jgi:RNA polymerase sigma factor (sigma-70 family)